jgi:hypothetical protein
MRADSVAVASSATLVSTVILANATGHPPVTAQPSSLAPLLPLGAPYMDHNLLVILRPTPASALSSKPPNRYLTRGPCATTSSSALCPPQRRALGCMQDSVMGVRTGRARLRRRSPDHRAHDLRSNAYGVARRGGSAPADVELRAGASSRRDLPVEVQYTDPDPAFCRAALRAATLVGHIYLHLGDDSAFRAVRFTAVTQ